MIFFISNLFRYANQEEIKIILEDLQKCWILDKGHRGSQASMTLPVHDGSRHAYLISWESTRVTQFANTQITIHIRLNINKTLRNTKYFPFVGELLVLQKESCTLQILLLPAFYQIVFPHLLI
jgi:hypothetical protein